MNRNLKLSALAVLLAATAVGAAEMRTLNLKSGATIQAEIVAFPTAETVEVKRTDGKVYSLPVAYLAAADRAYVDEERAKQWKQVSVDKVLGAECAGRYKKCEVSGGGVGGVILVAMLPSQVEAALNKRLQQEAQITNLNSQVQADSTAAKDAKAAAAAGGYRAYRRANRAEARLANKNEAQAKTNLNKLKADYAENVKKTQATTTVLMKNTGLVYAGLAVWECQLPQRQQ